MSHHNTVPTLTPDQAASLLRPLASQLTVHVGRAPSLEGSLLPLPQATTIRLTTHRPDHHLGHSASLPVLDLTVLTVLTLETGHLPTWTVTAHLPLPERGRLLTALAAGTTPLAALTVCAEFLLAHAPATCRAHWHPPPPPETS